MVNRWWCAALLSVVASCPVAADARTGSTGVPDVPGAGKPASDPAVDPYEDAWFYRAAPWKRMRVVSITVTDVGLGEDRRDADDLRPCAAFRPGARDVGDFVRRASVVSKQAFLHETTWSACHATGTVRFADGTAGTWMIQRYGAGTVTIDGRRHYFDCERCRLTDEHR